MNGFYYCPYIPLYVTVANAVFPLKYEVVSTTDEFDNIDVRDPEIVRWLFTFDNEQVTFIGGEFTVKATFQVKCEVTTLLRLKYEP